MMEILIIEDDSLAAKSLAKHLRAQSHIVSWSKNAGDAQSALEKSDFDVAFVDIDLDSHKDGLQLIPLLAKSNTYTVMITGHASDDYIEDAYEIGCDNYLTKPFRYSDVDEIISRNVKFKSAEERFIDLSSKKFLTNSEKLKTELRILQENLIGNAPIFFSGPSGVGKTLLASIVHESIYGSTDKFVEINCSAIPEALIESELFGHEAGAFTGAKESKKGKLLEADGGTLFLDEIGTMPISLQTKLLKAIAEKKFTPVGSNAVKQSNFRLISASCDDLFTLMGDGRFREDLFFRISGINIKIPSLAHRKDDLKLLIDQSIENFGRALVIKQNAYDLLMAYDWPGNVRELMSFFESIRGRKKPIICDKDLPEHIRLNQFGGKAGAKSLLTSTQLNYIQENGLNEFLELISVAAFDHFSDGVPNRARKVLNIGYQRLNRIIKKKDELECLRQPH